MGSRTRDILQDARAFSPNAQGTSQLYKKVLLQSIPQHSSPSASPQPLETLSNRLSDVTVRLLGHKNGDIPSVCLKGLCG